MYFTRPGADHPHPGLLVQFGAGAAGAQGSPNTEGGDGGAGGDGITSSGAVGAAYLGSRRIIAKAYTGLMEGDILSFDIGPGGGNGQAGGRGGNGSPAPGPARNVSDPPGAPAAPPEVYNSSFAADGYAIILPF